MAKRKQAQRPSGPAGDSRPTAGEDGRKRSGPSKLPYVALGGGVLAAVWALATLSGQGVPAAAYAFAYLEFYAGVVVLVSLSITVMCGLAATDRLILTPKHRVLVQGVHRTTGMIAVSFLALHIMVKILVAHASIIDVIIPFQNVNTVYVGMGTIASYCLVAAFWSGITRARFAGKGKPWMWRALHSIGYLCWPIALGHGLLAGRAAATWVIVAYILCVVGVVIALLVRVVTAYGRRINAPKAQPSAARAAGKAQSGPLEAANNRAAPARPMWRGVVRNQPSAEESLSAPRGAAWGGFSEESSQQRRQRQTPLPANAMEETQIMSKIPREVVEAAEELVETAAARRPRQALIDDEVIETRPVRRAPRPARETVDDYVPELVPELIEEETPRRRQDYVTDEYAEVPAPRRTRRPEPEPEIEDELDDYDAEPVVPRRSRRTVEEPVAEKPVAPRRSRRTEDDEEFGEAQISAAATPPRRTRRVVEEEVEEVAVTAPPSRRPRRAVEEVAETSARRARRAVEEVEPAPRRSRRTADEVEVEVAVAPRRARRAVEEDVEEEVAVTPRRARRAAADEYDEEEVSAPTRRARRAAAEPVSAPPAARRSHRAAENDEPEVAEVTKPRRARRAVEEDDEPAAPDEYWRPPVNPVSRYEIEVEPEPEPEPEPVRPVARAARRAPAPAPEPVVEDRFDGDDTPTLVDLASRRAARSARPGRDAARTRRPGRAAADEVSDEEFWARMRGEAK